MPGFNLGGALAGLGQFAEYWQKQQEQNQRQALYAQALAEKKQQNDALRMAYSLFQSGQADTINGVEGLAGLSGLSTFGGPQASGQPTGDTTLQGLGTPAPSSPAYAAAPLGSGMSSGLGSWAAQNAPFPTQANPAGAPTNPAFAGSPGPGFPGQPFDPNGYGRGGIGSTTTDVSALPPPVSGAAGPPTDLTAGLRSSQPPSNAPPGLMALIDQDESGNQNIQQSAVPPGGGYNPSVGRVTGPSSASGYSMITDETWQETAPRAGVDINQYPTAISAPRPVQQRVRDELYRERGTSPWAPYNAKLRQDMAAAGYEQTSGGGPPDIGAGLQDLQQSAAQIGRTAASGASQLGVFGRMSMKAAAAQIDKANPGADPMVKMMALEIAQKMMAPDQQMLLKLMMQQNSADIRVALAEFSAQNSAARQADRGSEPFYDAKTGKWWQVTGAGGAREVPLPAGATKAPTAAQAAQTPNPELVKYVVNKMLRYEMAPLSGFALRTPYGQAVQEGLAQHPEYDQTKYNQKQRTEIAGTTGRQGDTVRSFSVALDHLRVMDQAATALANGDQQTLNRLTNAVQKEFGYTGPVDFNFVKAIVGDEVTKAVIGGVGSVTDRQQLQQGFEIANSPEQLANVALRAKQLMAGQLAGLRRQLTSGGMSEQDFDKMLSESAREELGALGPGGTGGGPQQAPATGPGQQAQHPDVPAALQGKPGLQWSPSQKMWRDSTGALYDENGNPAPAP